MLLQVTNYIYSLVKKNEIMIKIILVHGFCPPNFKTTQFPDGFCLNLISRPQIMFITAFRVFFFDKATTAQE